MQQLLEPLPVLRHVDSVGAGAQDGNAGLGQRLRQFQRGLPTVLDDAAQQCAVLLLPANERNNVLGGQRLEVKPIGGVVIGADGFRVAVDHDGLEPRVLQRVGRMHAAIVELDALAYPVGPAAEDDDLGAVGRIGLADRRAVTAFIGGVHVRCGGGEFRRAGVYSLVDGDHAQAEADAGDVVRGATGQLTQPCVGEAQRLQAAQFPGLPRQAEGFDGSFGRDNAFHLPQEPRVELAGIMDVLHRQSRP